MRYIHAPGRYSLATKQVETFREVGLCMSAYEDEPDQQFELLQAAFAFVQAGRRYLDIRQLRKFFGSDREQFDRMMAQIQAVEDSSAWDAETAAPEIDYPELTDATAPEEEDDDSDGEDSGAVVAPADYPKRDVSNVIDGALDRFIASGLDVQRQLDQARARVEAVDLGALTELDGPARDHAKDAVAAIETWVQQARELLE